MLKRTKKGELHRCDECHRTSLLTTDHVELCLVDQRGRDANYTYCNNACAEPTIKRLAQALLLNPTKSLEKLIVDHAVKPS